MRLSATFYDHTFNNSRKMSWLWGGDEGGAKPTDVQKVSDPTKDTSGIEKNEKMAEEMVEALLTLYKAGKEDGWEQISDKNGLKISKKEIKGDSIAAFKGTATIKYDSKEIRPLFLDVDEYKKWDSMLIDGTVIEKKSSDGGYFELIHQKYQSPPMISNRDICCLGVLKDLEGMWVAAYRSVESPKVPEIKDFVRADVHISGFVFKTEGDATEVTYIAQMDPKGWIPTWAVNATGSEQAGVVGKMKADLESRKK
eukprot:TRINITY_DN2838_c0_g1_i1.p2 TRINITY_DN2838_c0_g1~~TRINITY_DN2838_c0_g1_i1.p2  ORF type:complete len:254 (+),score=59.47 TRINITY_DN2838_c0_g1_i1:911-1672(+)